MPTPYESEDVQHFDRWSSTYETSPLQRLIFDRVHRHVLALASDLPAPAAILDIGCGTGKLLRAAAARWPRATLVGVDPAAGMVEVARRLTPGATIVVGLGESLPLGDASVDLAFSTMSFHHWHDQLAGVREIARVLRPGGHFILADVAPPTWIVPFLRHSHAAPLPRRHAYFAAAGLRVIAERPVLSPYVVATVGAR